MNVTFTPKALADYQNWAAIDTKIFMKIGELIKDIVRSPYSGLGKPEALRHELSGNWSRRINNEHRLVYKIIDNTIVIFSCRYHYAR